MHDPFPESLSNSLRYRFSIHPHTWHPPTDIYETEDNYTIVIEAAGMDETRFSISADQTAIVIQGYRPEVMPDRRSIHQMEIAFGEFRLEVTLPNLVQIAKAQASYQNGFLFIELPKMQAHQINVNKG